MRIRTLLPLLLALALVAGACGDPFELRSRVLGFIGELERQPRRFHYEVEQEGQKYTVDGVVGDSFRWKAKYQAEGKDVADIVTDDDALAVRFISPGMVDLDDPAALGGGSEIVADTLRTGNWVVDPAGAPEVAKSASEALERGPLVLAVDILNYVRVAIDEAADINAYRPEDIDPAYLPIEDNFPEPDEEEGIRRFDLVRTAIPRPIPGQAAPAANPPQISDFRKMAIYVKGERILRILEEVELDDHSDFIEAREENKPAMLQLLEQIQNNEHGGEPIIERRMSVEFFEVEGDVDLAYPGNAVNAPLGNVLAVLPGNDLFIGEFGEVDLDEFVEEEQG